MIEINYFKRQSNSYVCFLLVAFEHENTSLERAHE